MDSILFKITILVYLQIAKCFYSDIGQNVMFWFASSVFTSQLKDCFQ